MSTAAKLDKNRDGALDLAELAHVSAQAPSVELIAHVRGGGGNQPPLTPIGASSLPAQAVRLNGNQAVVALNDTSITVQNADIGPARPGFNQFSFVVQQIKAADTKNRGYVELKDLDGPQLQFVRQLFPILDRDEDGKLTEKETQGYFDLQGQARDVFASFSVLEEGRNWLQLLDANRDGQLAPRELMNAWPRLQAHDRNSDGSIDAQELPLQFKVALNSNINQQFVVAAAGASMRGSAPAAAAYPPQAPLWFRKMDRNAEAASPVARFLHLQEQEMAETNHVCHQIPTVNDRARNDRARGQRAQPRTP
jgi:Ca2+-binding EF-hand superfamily protein